MYFKIEKETRQKKKNVFWGANTVLGNLFYNFLKTGVHKMEGSFCHEMDTAYFNR